ALIPTFLYVYSISQLGSPKGNYDIGALLGSYFGLLFLAGTYTAIGVFSSTLSKNQIVAFIIAMFISFILFYGFEAMASLFGSLDYFIQSLGLNEHYKSISRGVIDTRDLLYFISVTVFFLMATKLRLDRE
ncbi:MAG: ABC-2 type transport system permease protein, partial [Saprospiraceae bacterium]